LIVVVRIVVTVVGDALRNLLDQRRKVILSTLQEADKKAREAQNRLEEAKKSVETARLRTKEILDQAIKTAEQESFFIQEQLANDLQRLQDRGQQGIQLERQRTVQAIAQQVANLALITAESTLFTSLGSQGSALLKQKELNEIHVRDTFRKLKIWASSIRC
jgi:F0F1-type ATP synthase membrane subunit b/b'